MAKYLFEIYPLGCQVELYFEVIDRWLWGVVVDHASPAVWVQTADGRRWFVTNRTRIRLYEKRDEGQDTEEKEEKEEKYNKQNEG